MSYHDGVGDHGSHGLGVIGTIVLSLVMTIVGVALSAWLKGTECILCEVPKALVKVGAEEALKAGIDSTRRGTLNVVGSTKLNTAHAPLSQVQTNEGLSEDTCSFAVDKRVIATKHISVSWKADAAYEELAEDLIACSRWREAVIISRTVAVTWKADALLEKIARKLVETGDLDFALNTIKQIGITWKRDALYELVHAEVRRRRL